MKEKIRLNPKQIESLKDLFFKFTEVSDETDYNFVALFQATVLSIVGVDSMDILKVYEDLGKEVDRFIKDLKSGEVCNEDKYK